MGQVLTAGSGQIPARQAAYRAGIPLEVPAVTVNKVCLSGLDAIVLADQLIRAGAFDVVVAGGQESMSRAPRLLVLSRDGAKAGGVSMRDHAARDGLWDSFTDQTMGSLTEAANVGDRFFDRTEQEEYAARSHRLAVLAAGSGLLGPEIVPVGDPDPVSADEGPRAELTAESLAFLHPAYRKDGTITSGTASQSGDGACALVLVERGEAERRGLGWIAEVGAHGLVAGPDTSLQDQPANAIAGACAREGLTATDLDLVEINEAFAVVTLSSAQRLGLDLDRVNVGGGALALGHPIGASGARIALHLVLELARRGGGVGAAALCGGGGQGEALILRVPAAPGG
jgi:acetyl-CoA C-acetyltransferase